MGGARVVDRPTDIEQVLRDFAETITNNYELWRKHGSAPRVYVQPPVLREAAEEISRLRAELDKVSEEVRCIGEMYRALVEPIVNGLALAADQLTDPNDEFDPVWWFSKLGQILVDKGLSMYVGPSFWAECYWEGRRP